MKKVLPYILAMLLAYYALPLFIQDTGSGMFVLLFAIPLICLICSVTYSFINSFNVYLIISFSLLFIPSIFIYYNESAWIYAPAYGVLSLLGSLIGIGLKRLFIKRKKMK